MEHSHDSLSVTAGEKPGPDAYFGMLIKIWVASILMGVILFLFTMLPEVESYTAHVSEEIDGIFMSALAGWCLIFALIDRLKKNACYIGLALTSLMLGLFAVVLYHPVAQDHIHYHADHLTATRVLDKIAARNSEGAFVDIADVQVSTLLDNERTWGMLVSGSEITAAAGQCPFLSESMTVRELQTYVQTFDPHCIDKALGLEPIKQK